METISRQARMARLAAEWRRRGLSIGFVPTMGALHSGHAALIGRARRENRKVVVSIFVNPKQFGPNEDFGRYPRTFAADSRLCRKLGVDAIYHPPPEEMYPAGFATEVDLPALSSRLCGEFRPGHFKGVATVVLKLLATVRPGRAYFGEKDFQQLVLIKAMVRDLNVPTRIVGCPTVREPDGLALSSRNRYLAPEERSHARLLYEALRWGAAAVRPALAPRRLCETIRRRILKIPHVSIDYVKIVDPHSLEDAPRLAGSLRLLAAIRLGRTRLIDNVPVHC